MQTSTIDDILRHKGAGYTTIAPDTSVLQASKTLTEQHIGCLVVMESGRLLGIVSERDIVQKVMAAGRDPGSTTVKEVMTERVITVRAVDEVPRALQTCTQQRVRHLPVVDKNESVMGIISIGDLVKQALEDQAFTIDQLSGYIMGLEAGV